MSKRLDRVINHAKNHNCDARPNIDRIKAVEKKFGMRPGQFVEMALDQGGVCAICGGKSTGGKSQPARYLCVDHSHKTGDVRALLCNNCNTGLGMFRDSASLLRLAAAYLDRFE